MRVVRFHRYGGPEVLQVEDLEPPTPGSGEVLIEVAYAGVNFADTLLRRGELPMPVELPRSLGYEATGQILEVGPGVEHGPAVGTRVGVFLDPTHPGAYADLIIAPTDAVTLIPEELPLDAAVGVLAQGLTAYGLVHRAAGGLQKNETILVLAAAGGVGSLTVQLARQAGAGLAIGAAGAPDKLESVRESGAEGVSYLEKDWVERVLAATPEGRGADVIIDNVGGEVGAASVGALALGGRIVLSGAASGDRAMRYDSAQLAFRRGSVVPYALPTEPPEFTAQTLPLLFESVIAGELRVHTQTFSLDRADEAHRAIENRRTVGKVTLSVKGS